ncbi:MAG: septal ring lytic transglycosylase RlpA family protein [Ignavibacteria bacterium]
MTTLKLMWIAIFALIFVTPISKTLMAQTEDEQFVFHSEGTASWYGPGFHGRKTANGERFDTYDYTAAHKTLPFNTYVRVTNLENGKSTIVRINDRGPYSSGRIIDLSYAAKQEIGMSGLARVRLEIVQSPESDNIEKPYYSLFEDVLPGAFHIYAEYNKNEYKAGGIRNVFQDNLNLFSNTFKKISLKVFPLKTQDLENSTYPGFENTDELFYIDVTDVFKQQEGFMIEIMVPEPEVDIESLIGEVESLKISKPVYLLEILKEDSSSFKVLVGTYANEEECKNGMKVLEDVGLGVRLVKI